MLHKGFHSDCDDDNGDDDDDDDDDDDNVDDEADNENYDDDDDFIQVSGSTIVMTGGLDTEASVTEVFHFFVDLQFVRFILHQFLERFPKYLDVFQRCLELVAL